MSTTADVIAEALALGYRWVSLGGERPVLTNDFPEHVHPPGLQAHAQPLWTPVSFARCAWCQDWVCVEGKQRGHYRAGRHIFCEPEHYYQFHEVLKRMRREEARHAPV